MISLLLPTRRRPDNLRRLTQSVRDTAATAPELVAYVDQDDPESAATALELGIQLVQGPRVVLSEMWNRCCDRASGDILMHCGDDIVFRTPGWDRLVQQEFAACPDRILFVHGDDLSSNGHNAGTHGFLHRRWVETVGYFVPPLFSCDYNDTWLNFVADALGRRRYLQFVTEHLHPSFGKAELDQTHLERQARGHRDDVVGIWERTLPERQRDVAALAAYIEAQRS